MNTATYKYSKKEMEAATRMQIWQELMRCGGSMSSTPEETAVKAARIFDTLYHGAPMVTITAMKPLKAKLRA